MCHCAPGKTAFTSQQVHSKFISQHEATIEDSHSCFLDVDTERCRLQIIDTSGKEEYAELRLTQMKEGDGFILCFSITDRSSFYSVRRYYDDVIKARSDDPTVTPPCGAGSGGPGTGSGTRARGQTHSASATPRVSVWDEPPVLLTASNQRLSVYSEPARLDEFAAVQSALQLGVLLVGLKGDLWERREVEPAEIDALAHEMGLQYIELSCTSHKAVEAAFSAIVRTCRKVNDSRECVCGAAAEAEAAAASSARKSAATSIMQECICQQVCAQCHKRRFLHADEEEKHAFVETAPTPTVAATSCCTIM